MVSGAKAQGYQPRPPLELRLGSTSAKAIYRSSRPISAQTSVLPTIRQLPQLLEWAAVQSQIRKSLIRLSMVVGTCLVAFIAFCCAIYFWKEHVHHFTAGARADLLALHTMQENYRVDHGRYANNFSELGVPSGARLNDDVLLWDGPYQMRFTRLVRDQSGTVVHYTIEAKPDGSDEKLPTIEMDETGILKP